MIYVANSQAVTSTGVLVPLTTYAAPFRREIHIRNTGARKVYALPFSYGEAVITVTTGSGYAISTGAELYLEHSHTEQGPGYVSIGMTSTGAASVAVLAK